MTSRFNVIVTAYGQPDGENNDPVGWHELIRQLNYKSGWGQRNYHHAGDFPGERGVALAQELLATLPEVTEVKDDEFTQEIISGFGDEPDDDEQAVDWRMSLSNGKNIAGGTLALVC